MKFGNYNCFAIEFGDFILDGGAMFGVVPKILWEKKIPADKNNFIPMKARSLLIQGNGKNILVDNGPGSKLSDKMKKIYGIDDQTTDIKAILSKHQLTCDDITDVIITHLHFDHAGGSTIVKDNNTIPTFRAAKYYVQKSQFEAALNPGLKEAGSYFKENFLPLEESGVLVILDGPSELFDGIEIIISNGHTPGQQHPLVKGKEASLFYCADLIPTSAHIPIPWHMAYDNEPLSILKEKQEILSRAILENWILFFEHDPVVAAASVKKGGKDFSVEKVLSI
ncbi:MAG: MBL fold metallo-hydrolase [Proteobacteria bacterium]|nr:MBL fold metallo-hydrolase [Pseudomonadota bacterium]MBU4010817.1 MBL fold metallo-hydrolase [Pseudomonadota bacterium]MBU4037719.1 MBL fold metallo-hydrolase [Pseudomonadota bacterium]